MKPWLADLKKQIMSLNTEEVSKLGTNPEELERMYMQQPEVKKIKQEVSRLFGEVNNQTNENLEER